MFTIGPYEISVLERDGKLSLNLKLRRDGMRIATLLDIFSYLVSEARINLYTLLANPNNYKDQEEAKETIGILEELKDDLLSDEEVF
jgi:hypothetical protein